mmetsp:Transcript_18554/g.35343  ORF Transcript_18554/g.35343 Transcript_18554/m.35343 type:complete len:210 (+) Transcript_18554:497-1126(+)
MYSVMFGQVVLQVPGQSLNQARSAPHLKPPENLSTGHHLSASGSKLCRLHFERADDPQMQWPRPWRSPTPSAVCHGQSLQFDSIQLYTASNLDRHLLTKWLQYHKHQTMSRGRCKISCGDAHCLESACTLEAELTKISENPIPEPWAESVLPPKASAQPLGQGTGRVGSRQLRWCWRRPSDRTASQCLVGRRERPSLAGRLHPPGAWWS